MRTGPLAAVMFFVDDQLAAARWYRDLLGAGELVEDGGYVFLDIDGFEVGFHPADPVRNPQGGSVVAYFATHGLDAHRARAIAAGARPHRGPLDVPGGRAICQLIDPFGNIFGLDGPHS